MINAVRKSKRTKLRAFGLIVIASISGSAGCQGLRHPMLGSSSQQGSSGLANGNTNSPGSFMGPVGKSKDQGLASNRTTNASSNVARNNQGMPSQGVVPASFGGGNGSNAVLPAQYASPQSHPSSCPCGMHGDSTYHPMLPSLQSQMCAPESQGCNQPCATCPPGYDPQEYLFDGGDRNPRVVVQKDGQAVGLQPEDTVVTFELDNGSVCVEPACRAAIYAPRFAAVRKVASPIHSDCVVATKAALAPEGPNVINERLPSPVLRQPIGPSRENSVKIIESFRERNRGTPMDRVLPVMNLSDAFQPFENLQLLKHGRWEETDRIKLRKGVEAALVWGTADEIQVLVNENEALEATSTKGAAETVVYELNGKPRIRICKVASQQLAEPGDEIHFTIRLDNVGEREVKNVVILDSLAPRLEFVEASQQSSIEMDFESVENEVGSMTLRWKCTKTLKPGEGGVIRFKCRVR